MQTLKINKSGTLVIPRTLRTIFKPSDQIAWFAERDMLILKRVTPPRLSEIASRVKEKPLALKEIVKEIHVYRREKRSR